MAELEGTLTKESVRIILRSFNLNHEDESLERVIEFNLDKINDSNVKEMMRMLADYKYWYVTNSQDRKDLANKITSLYGIDKSWL